MVFKLFSVLTYWIGPKEDGDYYVDNDDDKEDFYEGEGDLDDEADVAMEDGCTAACQDILGSGCSRIFKLSNVFILYLYQSRRSLPRQDWWEMEVVEGITLSQSSEL